MVDRFPIDSQNHFMTDPIMFTCFMDTITRGLAAGIMSRQSIASYMLMRLHKRFQNETKVIYGGKNWEGFLLKVGKKADRRTWRLWTNRKYEPWEEELNLHIQRLYSSGIPDFFLTNKDFIAKNQSNPF